MTAATPTPARRRKLIEVALPLEAINAASAREKSIRHGHPSTLHLWWARRPLAACRAVLFASLVDDPGDDPTLPEAEADRRRQELFDLIEDLVQWENSTNEEVLGRARAAILASTGGNPPPVLDPFCGGGSIPLEAQRLGLEAHGSDLNPVAVLITKALVEIPPRFANRAPVHPDARRLTNDWRGAQGLAADVRAYGAWMRDEAARRIGHLYPAARLPKELGGGEATVIAWLWARTVRCPNPACGAEMPLVRSFALSTKKGKETRVEPVVEPNAKRVRFEIRRDAGDTEGTVNRKGATCLTCRTAVPFPHIRAEAKAGRMGAQLMAIVAEGNRQRLYLPATAEQAEIAERADPPWKPVGAISHWPGRTNVVEYGLTTFADLFTPRQLVALTTFSDLVGEARQRALADALAAGMTDDGTPLEQGGRGAQAYADAVATYLAFALSKMADRGSSICTWFTERDSTRNTFARQAIPMTWDFAEMNPLLAGTGSFEGAADWTAESVEAVTTSVFPGYADQGDARSIPGRQNMVVSTDPPYYDNIGYADLSDFFYVWLRRSLKDVYPNLVSTLLTPKSDELIASPYRHDGSKAAAERFFEDGLADAFERMRAVQHPDYPLTVFYAFKQSESESDAPAKGQANGVASTGWETMLEGLIAAGFSIDATWPVRTELGNRTIASGTNALASSIVLACRPRPEDAPVASRADLVRALRRELPGALRQLQHGNVAPVDLAQAAIGPGMAIYTRFRAVREPSGDRLSVRTALALINQVLDEVQAESENDYDPDTRLAVAWFEQHGFAVGRYGDAETLARAKGAAVAGAVAAGIFESGGGKARLLRRDELPAGWDPAADARLTVWEVTQHLAQALQGGGGQAEAGRLLARVGPLGEAARELAYRLYTVCERKGWSADGQAYNGLVVAWPEIAKAAADAPAVARVEQARLMG